MPPASGGEDPASRGPGRGRARRGAARSRARRAAEVAAEVVHAAPRARLGRSVANDPPPGGREAIPCRRRSSRGETGAGSARRDGGRRGVAGAPRCRGLLRTAGVAVLVITNLGHVPLRAMGERRGPSAAHYRARAVTRAVSHTTCSDAGISSLPPANEQPRPLFVCFRRCRSSGRGRRSATRVNSGGPSATFGGVHCLAPPAGRALWLR